MSDTKDKLQKIKEKASSSNVSLSEIEELNGEFSEICRPLMQDKEKKEEKKLARETEKALFNAILNLIDKWIKGEIEPSDTEISFLHEYWTQYRLLEVNLAIIEKSINESKQFDKDEKQESIGILKKNIEELKKRQADLVKLFQQWQKNKHRSEKENNDSDDTNGTSEETSQKDMSSHSSVSDTSSNSKENKKGKFPVWGIVLIIFVILLIAGTIVYFVLEKKEKLKTTKKTKDK